MGKYTNVFLVMQSLCEAGSMASKVIYNLKCKDLLLLYIE